MPKINLCFLWHMHQPLYKDLVSGEYRLPWARLHGLKDYFGMVKILQDFPKIHQTFNLVPSLLIQIKDYVSGAANDPFLKAALKPAEFLTPIEKEFILNYFFQANEERVICRYPRYAELFSIVQRHDRNLRRAVEAFDPQMLRDLQVLSQLSWFDEEDLEKVPRIRALAAKGRMYSLDDQQLVGSHQLAALERIADAYREAAARGQIELSASAFYHPILPLLCDSNVAGEAHPYMSLPQQFCYPQDAEQQLRKSIEYFERELGVTPTGLWPSEGSISEAALAIAARAGFRWTASDDEVLARSLDTASAGDATYQPYRWQKDGGGIDVVFRDRRLSNLIAFVYSQMAPDEAAKHFVGELRRSCKNVLEDGRDAMVAIILDGENAWEAYPRNGRPFLRSLYAHISDAPDIRTLTMSRGIESVPKVKLPRVSPGSWIDANFDIWIGAEEDNAAWEQLLAARRTYDAVMSSDRASLVTQEAKQAAWEELLIAEGSDWCWWYGPEHPSANQGEFDQLYRDHLANVYRLLGEEAPASLSVPISRHVSGPQHEAPAGLIQPTIDGILSSRAEWANAGRIRPGRRTGALHGQRPLVQDLYYGSDGQSLYIRADLTEPLASEGALEFFLQLRTSPDSPFEVRSEASSSGQLTITTELPDGSVQVALRDIYEARVSLSAIHARLGDPVHLRFTVLREGLPIASLPASGEVELQGGTLAVYAY